MKRSTFAILFLLSCVACTDYVGQIDDLMKVREEHERVRSESSTPTTEIQVDPKNVFEGSFEDPRDNHVYRTVTIGSQTWMAENLNYAAPGKYGEAGSFCYDDKEANCNQYGRLYTWSAAMDSAEVAGQGGKGCGYGKLCVPSYPVQGVCPDGWHLPSTGEWETLLSAVDRDKYMVSGYKLKSRTGWVYDSVGVGEDEYGFSVLAAGEMMLNGKYYHKGTDAYFWTATDGDVDWADCFHINLQGNSSIEGCSKNYANSVRCVKDSADKKSGANNGNDDSGVSCEGTDLWCKNNTYRVYTGIEEYDDESGYWWVEYDHEAGGHSDVEWPVARGNDYSALAFDPVIEYCNGLCGTMKLVQGDNIDDPFISVGFDIPDAPVNVSDWKGLCITYTSSKPASLVLRLDSEKERLLEYDLPSAFLPTEYFATEKCFSWSGFEQSGWSMESISGTDAAKILRGVAFRIQASDRTMAEFNIIRLRKLNLAGNVEFSDSLETSELADSIPSIEYGTIVDSRDGREYKTLAIGSRTWMAENLSYDALGSYCREDLDDCERYGRVYTWAIAIDSVGEFSTNGKGCGYYADCEMTSPVRGICPEGWHLPNGEDFSLLMKEFGDDIHVDKTYFYTSGWIYNENGDEGHGFTFWIFSDGDRDSGMAGIFVITPDYDDAFTTEDPKNLRNSVRCVKD